MKAYRLRPINDKDKAQILAWRNHPEVRSVMLTDHVIREQEHENWWQRASQQDDLIRLIVEHNEKPVALINYYKICHQQRRAWWGFYIDNAGVTTHQARLKLFAAIEQLALEYARIQLDLVELFCETLQSNEVVLAMHHRAGFEICSSPLLAQNTNKNVVYMCKRFAENLARRVYFMCSYVPENLLVAYEAQIKKHRRFEHRVERVPFAQYPIALHDTKHSINQRSNDILVFCERLEDLIDDVYVSAELVNIQNLKAAVERYFIIIRHAIQTHPGREIYVFDFEWITPRHLTLAQTCAMQYEAEIQLLNKQLYSLCAELGVVCFPYAFCLKSYGVESAFSQKYWYLARMPFSQGFAERLAKQLVAIQSAQNALNARVLVLDLDNTLWHGVIGDDGLSGIQLGGDYPGNIYKDLQILFRSFLKKGFLLALCSKNTKHIALEAINKHPEMVLKESDFVAMEINWQDKSENIRKLAETLNLGLSSFCFVDDNPLERAEVRQTLPDVYVPELPIDPAEWYAYLCRLPELMLMDVNETDRKRQALYQQRTRAHQSQINHGDKTAFIKSLQIEISLQMLNAASFARCLQLFTKTNQFNTTTQRYTSAQLKSFARSNDTAVWYVASRDKFSTEYEGIAALVVSKQHEQWCIENFVMSCRVMGRTIENAVINQLVLLAQQQGVRRICGRYIASERNQPVADLYANLGFIYQENLDLWCKTLPAEISEESYINVTLNHTREEWTDV
ncbi:MAG: HAD-IIIC family phosphatase [Chromatiaceae bacterium]|nr:HAD-IIIC family phosphatase [Chromatiaceae bacterium]